MRAISAWILLVALFFTASGAAQAVPPAQPVISAMGASAADNALLKAAQNSKFDDVMKLVRSGMDPSVQDILGKNALMLILESGHPDVAVSFIKEVKAKLKPDTSSSESLREIPLDFIFAVERKNQALQAADSQGRTALMIAAANGYADVVRLLVSEGVSVDARNSEGLTAAMIAEKAGHSEIVEILSKKAP